MRGLLAAGVVVAVLIAAAERDARACGGCFAPQDTVTSVSAHRMVIALGTEETYLWDQIRYTGDPEDFVWVLPVPNGDAEVELADVEFFDQIDATTAPRIQPARPLQFGCPQSAGMACGAAADNGAPASNDVPEDGVTVYSEDTVGPYEYAVIGSESTDALRNWLVNNGYAIPPATVPIIDHYVMQGSAFIALRLQPDAGVDAMQPVRVRYSGYMGLFPLKMVTVGAYGEVELSLWIIAQQRMETSSYANATVDADDVVWDWATNTSDYGAAFQRAIDEAAGRAWVTESVQRMWDLYIEGDDAIVAEETVGMGDLSPVVTRMRTNMLIDHLTQDMELVLAADPSYIDPLRITEREINRPEEPDCDGTTGCKVRAGGLRGSVAWAAMLAAALACVLVLRRRRS